MHELIEKLKSLELSERLNAVSSLSDIAEYGEISRTESEKIADFLIESIVAETDNVAIESYLNLLCMISSKNAENSISANWERLVSILPRLDDQNKEYVICILGFARNPAYVSVIEPFRASDSEAVRAAATEALAEIDYALKK
jgi:hypothetical protein